MRVVRYSYPTARNPWSGLEGEIDRLFQSALTDFATPTADRFPVDLYEDSDNVYVRAELPGVNRDEIHVELVNGYLNIAASRKTKEGDTEESFSFSRSVAVPDGAVQAAKIAATHENGVLTVTLPKPEEVKPKKVTVAVS